MGHNKEYRQALKSFSYLWLVDDAQWLKDRKKSWVSLLSTAFNGSGVDEVRKYQDYFIYGNKQSYIPDTTLYSLTPFQTREQADKFFLSKIFTDDERQLVVRGGFGIELRNINSECRDFVRNYLKQLIEWRRGAGVKDVYLNNELCYRPDDFVKSYINYLYSLFNKRKKYSPSLDLLGYFLKSLPLLNDQEIIENFKSKNIFAKLFERCIYALDEKNATVGMKEQASHLLNNRDEIEAIWEKISSES